MGYPNPNYKISILEQDSTELGVPTELDHIDKNVAVDTSDQIASANVHDAIKEAKDISISFGDQGEDFCENTLTSYKIFRSFVFPGTNNRGTPLSIKIVGAMALSNRTGRVRIYDLTNDNEIATVDITSTTKTIYTISSFSNLPTEEAVFEIQAREVTGGTIRVHGFLMEFI